MLLYIYPSCVYLNVTVFVVLFEYLSMKLLLGILAQDPGQESDVSNPPEHYIAKVNSISQVLTRKQTKHTPQLRRGRRKDKHFETPA